MVFPVLIQQLVQFGEFLLVGLPKRLIIVGLRVLALVNYETSFLLHLRLITKPLYGDYTRAGRVIGLVFRLLAIFYGLAVLTVLLAVVLILPLLWYFILVWSVYRFNGYVGAGILSLAVVWWLYTRNKPVKRGELRPFTLAVINNIKVRGNLEVRDFVTGPAIKEVLYRLELDKTDFPLEVAKAYSYEVCRANSDAWLSKSIGFSREYKNLFVEPEHLFLAILSAFPNLEKFLYKYGLVFSDFENCARWLVEQRDEKEQAHVWQDYYQLPPMGGIGKGLTGRVTPNLDGVSTDFTQAIKKGLVEKTYWRETEIKRVAELLGGSNRNLLVVGPPGCGKTGIIKGIAYSVIKGTNYEQLRFKRIVSLEVGKILAGTKGNGDVAAKLKNALEDALTSRDVLLFVDDIHTLIAGSQAEDTRTSSAYTILSNYLADGRLQFIGATNIENYRKYIEPNGSFSQLFQRVEIPPSSKEETLEIIKVKAENLERNYHVKITFCALKKIVELSDRLIHERVFPDKAVSVLDRSVASVAGTTKLVSSPVVLEVLTEITNIPVTEVSGDESQKLLTIEEEMKKRVIGQDEALTMIGSSLKRARVGIRNQSKPVASFLFVGTTGVGKTETAKALARCYFGDEKLMIRLDMSEYQQKDSINRLLGNTDGSTKGILTEAIRTRPCSLILLDEIEKAHQDILLTFLQVMDDGRLTDSSGMTMDFTNAIIIATSNVGTRSIQEVFSRNGSFEEMKEVALREVREKFAPEFLNRFNGTIVYKPLTMDSVRKIAIIMLDAVKKLAEEKGIKVSFKPVLTDQLVRRGFSPEWGARPMARVIEETVMNYLAVRILSKEIVGGDTVELGTEVFN
jgi:ATP-dependent Clp protease ATP-binding subunit ClpC